jgi:hypothetical protein
MEFIQWQIVAGCAAYLTLLFMLVSSACSSNCSSTASQAGGNKPHNHAAGVLDLLRQKRMHIDVVVTVPGPIPRMHCAQQSWVCCAEPAVSKVE